jgi:alpha-phosphoglucomutase
MSKEDAVTAGLYEVIGKEVDDAYIAEVEKQVINQASIDEMASKLKIVYTPLHGTGNLPVRRVLDDLGFKNVYVVPEQELPDGDFPTVSYPNPEAKEAFALGLALAKEKDADLVLATDPDADRLGVYVKDAKSGEYIPLTGNMSGSLLCEYVLSQKKEKAGSLPADGAVVKSIVTTNLVDEIAKAYNVKLIEVLTGFKWIGKEILGFEQSGKGTYLFGLEESYGCLIGTYARDKDAVSATVALCEAAAYYATKGKTLWDVMIDMYEKYGYCVDSITAMDFPGLEGMDKMKAMLANLRENPLKDIAGYKVLKIRDYSKDTVLDVESGKVEPTGLPSSDVLYYELESGAWVCVRPSGTEPKIKFYYGVKASSMDEAQVESAKFAEWAKAQA